MISHVLGAPGGEYFANDNLHRLPNVHVVQYVVCKPNQTMGARDTLESCLKQQEVAISHCYLTQWI